MKLILRLLLAIVSLIYAIVGAALLILGIIYGAENFSKWTGNELDISGVVVISVGGVLFFIGFLGVVTSCSRLHAISYCFALFLFLLIVAQAIVAIIAVFFRPEIENFALKSFKETMKSYTINADQGTFYENSVSRIWDMTQSSLGCCGVDSYNDWSKVSFGEDNRVPNSCCTIGSVNSGNTINGGITVDSPACGLGIIWNSTNPTIYQEGCATYLIQSANDYLAVVLGIAGGFLAIQILGVCFACCLGRSVQVANCNDI